MLDSETFLTTLFVKADDFAKSVLPAEPVHPGAVASLNRSEVIALATFAQWRCFASESAFYRYANARLRGAFPGLPGHEQFNRLVRQHWLSLIGFFQHLGDELGAAKAAYQALDGLGVQTRNSKRRGFGWLAGIANVGHSNRLGWYEGLYVMTAATPDGVITGYGIAPASTNDRVVADTFLAARQSACAKLPMAGKKADCTYLADKGFNGRKHYEQWRDEVEATVLTVPPRHSDGSQPWPRQWRKWLSSHRQIIETVHDKLIDVFRLDSERPHALDGFQARLAANAALHNFCIWLNVQLGRPKLAFADPIDL